MPEIRIDALLPAEMARRAEYIGERKSEAPTLQTFALAILAGAFIAFGAVFATTVATGASGILTYGVTKLFMGLVFCLGLILVVVGGAELFTGNNLIVMAWASGKVTTKGLLRNWGIVYVGNFVGSLVTVGLVFASKQYTSASGGVGTTVLSIANGKVVFGFWQALSLGILCNILVCLAVWLTFSARSTADKIAAIIFPITAFVAAGFEHSVANMYFVPIGLAIKDFDPAFAASTGLDLSRLTWGAFLLNNLLPVTIGNIIGGSVFVAAIYWMIFLRPSKR
ncbi:MAG: formate transporter FocA [Anaerolineae bacterium]|jgi:formate transporter|nr:formate transporter FocA [Anaerolineae bacterium]MBT7072217.1 formate transporter FocA [Anaerolineae bacterium]MBT7323965.1 formate transporter FocA [Anaerolineae bacterium]